MNPQIPHDFPGRNELSWHAREVVRELDDRTHLLLRIRIRGGSFPQLDAPPFVRVLGRRRSVESWFAQVAEDGSSLSGYFPVDARILEGVVEYGYGSRVFGRVPAPFDPLEVERLERPRLPEDLVVVTEQFIRRKQAGRLPPDIRMPAPRRRRRR
jgi:hypothetical protein